MRKKLLFFLVIILFQNLHFGQSNPYLLVISFDGFRWDYTDRGITPNLKFIKENGVSALTLQPCYPTKTFPNHIAIITGMYPQNHGIIGNTFYDPISKETYRLSDTAIVKKSKWYKGELLWETAKRQGVKTASYFWPSAEMNLRYRQPDYFMPYEHTRPYLTRVEGVINWLKLPYAERPHLIFMYFDAADSYGHDFGTESTELNNAIMMLDSLVGKLFTKLDEINMRDSLNVIILSDHGMTDISPTRQINVDEILIDEEFASVDKGPFMYIYSDSKNLESIYKKLKTKENHYRVFRREEIPDYLHFKYNPMISEIYLMADLGWSLVRSKDLEKSDYNTALGNHGYDNSELDMHGIFMGIGPVFKQGFKTGSIRNIDIYPLVCKILDIIPNQKIDGEIGRLNFLLKNRE